MQHLIEPLVVSWGWERGTEADSLLDLGASTSRFIAEHEWRGTRGPAAFLSVPATIQFQTEHNWRQARKASHELLREARQRIEEYGRSMLRPYEPISPDSLEWHAQMAAFPLPPCDGATLKRRLYDEYRVEVPVIDWNGRQLLRVSVQGYNTRQVVEALLKGLKALLPRKANRLPQLLCRWH